MSQVFQAFEKHRMIPVIALDSADSAVPLACALRDGGLPIAEITFRTDAAEDSIRRIKEQVPDILVGAGTVRTTEQARRAIDAGAAFVVTPGFNARVVEYCLSRAIPITPGVATPTDIEAALEHELTLLKFFPAEAAGGTAMLKAFAGPYGDVKFIPTGGIKIANLEQYLTLPNVLAIGGSWMVPRETIGEGDFDAVGKLVREAVSERRKILGEE